MFRVFEHLARQSCFLFLVVILISGVHARHGTTGKHHHAHHHKARDASVYPSVTSSAISQTFQNTPTDLAEAQQMVKNAHQALKIANKGRLTYPEWNEYKFQDGNTLKMAFQQAPALEYASPGAGKETSSPHAIRDGTNTTRFRYTVSPELAEAARVIAEAFPSPVPTDYGVDIAKVISMYRVTPNDTNTPPRVRPARNGLDTVVYPTSDNDNSEDTQHSDLRKRATTKEYWLTELAKKGSSPFAPAGYKVSFHK